MSEDNHGNLFGRCVDCKHFLFKNGSVKNSSCAVKPGYITRNALRKLYCKDFVEIIYED